ncbi:hypothetical protein ND808_32405 [Streptomyces sp. DR7-3]|uniref:hypothetical protein n=1 Tax=Streptomyces malaysiensis TaxID=92644 RepID=UPI00204359B3|nr:hypothetical protein [Streptomyces sp. DR7-3]MCM3810500.1 hypothetical protein [Streptomyces sp. DR7-3]
MIRHLDEVRAALNRDSHQCQKAGSRSQPGGGPAPEALQEAIGSDTALLARGVRANGAARPGRVGAAELTPGGLAPAITAC